MRRLCAFLLCLLFSATLHADTGTSVRDALRAFYRYHFAHDMAFTPANVEARSAWLTPELLALARRYFAQPSSPDEVPDIDGDPFTDAQEYPKSFRIEGVRIAGNAARANVRFSGGGGRAHKVVVSLQRAAEKDAWLIGDVAYDDGPSFRELLATGRP